MPLAVHGPRPGGSAGHGPTAAGREYDANARVVSGDYGYVLLRAARLTAPAVCLLVTSLIGALANGYMTFSLVVLKNHPAEFDKVIQDAIARNPNMPAAQQAQMKEWMNWFRDHGTGPFGVLLALNLVTALGAIQMLRRRMYGLAVLANILALNPVNFGCCFLFQVPFGLWGLIVLFMGESRRAFQ